MSRRRKFKKGKKGSTWLNPEMEEVQAALSTKIRKQPCQWDDCAGMGYPGNECSICTATIPLLSKKGKQMPIEFPEDARSKKSHSTGTTYYGGGTGWQKHQHEGDKIIYEHDGKKLYAASGNGLKEYSGNWELIIDLAHNIRGQKGFIEPISTPRFQALKKFTFGQNQVKSEILQLDWPDMGVAPATIDFWLALWDMLPERTVTACMGGHGRTGTALVAMIIASGGMDYYEALKHVRTTHCEEAVETLSQEQYLHRLYTDYLIKLLSLAENQNEADEINAELKYAKENVPGTFSGKQKYSSHTGTTYNNPVSSHVPVANKTPSTPTAGRDWEEGDWKQQGGIVYIKQCTKADCIVVNCKLINHTNWIPWDPEEGVNLN